ncbi:P-loop containing nucleoside triphosphate hydrolase protein, partial [Wallemia mellicola]
QRLELVINACKVANADGFINTLPEKYDNSVGERGMLLSGGQKQRVAIARAIVSDPPILLLDEATAALDSASESIVQKALDKAAKNRTTIAIAHRLSTIKNANQIIVMGGGEILEVGDHNSLTANPDGAYSTFVAAQSLAQAKDEEAAQVNSDVVEKNDDLHEDVIPLNRVKSGRSVTSQILEKNNEEKVEKEHHYSMFEVIRRLVKMNRPGWSAYTSGSIAALVTGSAYPIMGILLGRILQHIAARSPTDPDYHSYIRHQIDRDSLWFFIMAIGAALGILIQSWAMHYAGELLTYALRHESFKKLLRSDVEYFDKKENSTGVLTSNLADNAQKVQGLAGISASTIIQSCSTLIVGVAIGIGYNWKLGLVGTACIPLTLSAGITRLKIVVTKDQQNKKSYEDSAEMACEAAGAIRTVASLTREGQALEEYQTLLRTPLRNSIRTSLWSSAIYGLSQGMAFLVIALIFWYGSQLIMNLEIELEDFYVCLMAVVFSSIQAGNVDVSNARGGAARILKLLDTKTEIEIETTSQDGIHLDTVEGHITFEDVHFRYPTRSDVPVLRSLDLEIKPGSYVALVGPSGCGKSTTIQLIERFYDPAYGSVKLDGHELRDLNLNNLRSHMALVSQEPTLYAGTVKYNILMGAVKPH